jgi:hypothetical protein
MIILSQGRIRIGFPALLCYITRSRRTDTDLIKIVGYRAVVVTDLYISPLEI